MNKKIMFPLTAQGDGIDAAIAAAVDGTNTTRLWELWLSFNLGNSPRYKILEKFARIVAGQWKKTYTLKAYSAASDIGTTTITPMDDLAGRSPAQLCTEMTTPVTDWADEDPMTWYVRANAVSLADGSMDILAFEGEDTFDLGGDIAPVYAFSIAQLLKKATDGDFSLLSIRVAEADGFVPDAGDIAPDNTRRLLSWHPCFGGGLTADGKLTSGAGKKPYLFASAASGNTAAKKQTPYDGLWCDADHIWLLRQWWLRHFDKENSGICTGCLDYNYQYYAAIAEQSVTRVLLTPAQGANLVVGSTVSLGTVANNASKDRGQSAVRNIAEAVKIASIEAVDIDGVQYAAVEIDGLSAPIDTTAETLLSTWPWIAGDTERLPSHKDGCTYSLTAGKTPIRVAGVEIIDGAYVLSLDNLYQVTANVENGWDYAVYECRDSEKLAENITADYEFVVTVTGIQADWSYIKGFFDTGRASLFSDAFGGASNSFFKSAFYGPSSAGVRAPWRVGNLSNGVAFGGLACEHGYVAPSNAYWNGRPRLGVWDIKALIAHISAHWENPIRPTPQGVMALGRGRG